MQDISTGLQQRQVFCFLMSMTLKLDATFCTYMIRVPNKIITTIRSCLDMLTFQTGRMTQTERMTSVIMLNIVTAYRRLPFVGQFDGKNIHGFGSWH